MDWPETPSGTFLGLLEKEICADGDMGRERKGVVPGNDILTDK